MQYIPLSKNGLDRLTRDDTVESLLEPGNSPIIFISHYSTPKHNPSTVGVKEKRKTCDLLLRLNPVRSTDLANSVLPGGNSHTRSAHDDVEVHTEDTDSGVVLDTEVDVLLNTETEVTGLGEVPKERVSTQISGGGEQREKTDEWMDEYMDIVTNLLLNSYSLTFKARSKTSSALGPRMVTWAAIFSFLRIWKDRIVYRALEVTGV